jgi:hypothetical protein
MRRAASKVLETHWPGARKMHCLSLVLLCVTVMSLSSILSMGVHAQASESQRSALSPPVNHETGRVEEVITAADDGYHFGAYVLTWRSMRIVVAGAPGQSYVPGDNLDFLVYRSEVNGHKVLRFESNSSASNENVVDRESANSRASITLGTARIEDTVSADSDGYRFAGYFVTWHDKRVFVVDPLSAPTRATGETINFRVLRTGLGAGQRLSFSL